MVNILRRNLRWPCAYLQLYGFWPVFIQAIPQKQRGTRLSAHQRAFSALSVPEVSFVFVLDNRLLSYTLTDHGGNFMELFCTLLLLALGILLIVKGGDFFVDAASWIAEVSGIPKFIVGATIVSLATTLPELIVSILAAADGKADMAAGNAIGSVTANTGLIMAVSILLLPAVIHRKKLMGKGILMLASAAALLFACRKGVLTPGGSILLLLLFILFIIENLHGARLAMLPQDNAAAKPNPEGKIIAANVIKFVLGAAGIVFGAELLVENGSSLARICGVSERIIGVTVLAIGTALPELVTTITAVIKKQSTLSIGNIIGANIIDLCLILPLCSIVSGGALPVAQQACALYLPVCLTVAAIGILPALIFGKFSRWQGILMLAIYILFLTQA